MTFLNSLFLFGLIAGAIPIVIHLLTRQKAKTIKFSSLRFLKKLENEQIKRLKVKQLLLLIIRTLVILLLVFAFARPTLKGRFFSKVGTAAKTSTVVILDNSLSLAVRESGQSLYDQLKAAMATNLDQIFSAGDEIFALHSTRGAPTLFEGARYNFESVGKIIQKSKVSHRVSDYFSALLAAERILENSRNANREIFFVSDFQLSGFNGDSAVVRELRADKDYQLFVVPVRKKRISNLVVSQIKIENQIIEKGKLFELSAIVKNTGDLELKNKLLQVFLENDRMGQATVSLSPGETQTIKFKLVPTKTGIISGFVA
ncbi:MAG TPA: VWA domain-containing protein, partial [bacterium]|nr:VWA domain-containing protein [bacterium]